MRSLRLNNETHRLTIVVDHPLDAVPENHDVEVNQQSDLNIQETKVGEELSLVDGVKRVFAFGLDNDFTFHDQVCSKSAIKFNAVIDQGYCFLTFNLHA